MTFETLAAEELLSVAKKLSDAAEERARAAAAAAVDAARAESDQKLLEATATAEQTLARMRAESDAAVAQANADAEGALNRLRDEHAQALAALRAEADESVKRARAEAEAAIAEARAADGGAAERLLEESAQELARVRAEGAAALETAQALHAAEIASVRAASETALAELRAKSAVDLAAMRAAAEAEIIVLRTAAENAARTNAAFGSMIDKLRNDQTQLAAENERLAAENAAFVYERADVLERAQTSQRAPLLARLRHTFHAITEATSLDAVLAAASAGLDDGSGQFVVRDGKVLCVDATGRTVPGGDDEAGNLLELLRVHVGLRLDRLDTEIKAATELRAYAQMLIDEVEYVYDADASGGKPEAARLERLIENVRCARQIYQQRVTVEGPAASALLEEALEHTCERKGAQPFGRDLARALASRAPELRAAQAS